MVLTGLGIVAAKGQLETSMISKSGQTRAHGRLDTFVSGFCCKLADAVWCVGVSVSAVVWLSVAGMAAAATAPPTRLPSPPARL